MGTQLNHHKLRYCILLFRGADRSGISWPAAHAGLEALTDDRKGWEKWQRGSPSWPLNFLTAWEVHAIFLMDMASSFRQWFLIAEATTAPRWCCGGAPRIQAFGSVRRLTPSSVSLQLCHLRGVLSQPRRTSKTPRHVFRVHACHITW